MAHVTGQQIHHVKDKPMKNIIEIICSVAQGIATVIIAGAMGGIFAGSAYSAFRWVTE